jgi:tetratricopeptide (TPR) repeat protein
MSRGSMLAETTNPPNSDELFRRGLEALDRKQYQQAIVMIQSAIEQDRQEGASKGPRMRFMSYLGLALNLSQGRSDEGLKLCEQAAKRDFFDADIFCNLGIVHLRHRQKGPAFDAFRKGLALKHRHARILYELARIERRDAPVFPWLARDHFLNHSAGVLRYRMRQIFNRAPGFSE